MSIQPYDAALSVINNIIRSHGASALLPNGNAVQHSHSPIVKPTSNPGSDSHHQAGSPVSVTGTNYGQLAQVNISALGSSKPLSLHGSVLQTAKAATLTVVGRTGGTVNGGGSYLLSGSIGSTRLELTDGESLQNVAAQVNQATKNTGVAATVTGNNLVLSSTLVGSRSTVSLQPLQSNSQSISGLNAAQVGSFQVVDQAPSTTDVIAGNVVSSANGASLVYHGASGDTVAGSATFRLTGSLGSSDISINRGESLSAVAGRINQQANSTGVIASVEGNDLKLSSNTTGAAATVQVGNVDRAQQITKTGGDNSQISAVTINSIGADTNHSLTGTVLQSASKAQVTLQGSDQDTVIDSATFQVTGDYGSFSIAVAQGQTLSDVAAQVNTHTNSTGVAASVDDHKLVFQSSNVGSTANVAVQLTDITHTTVVSGVESQQLASFQVDSLTIGASDTISGEVTQAATQAQVTLQGSDQDTVIDSANFQVTGELGSFNVAIAQGQLLSDVAAQVNVQTNSTGVVATVADHKLVFQSSDVGSAANVAVQLTDITHKTVVSDVDSQQLASFQADSFTSGASDRIGGEVTQAATQAQVTLQGTDSDTVVDTATFTLTGALGSADISIEQGQALSDVASQINTQSASTGVVASVDSHKLVFQSTEVGSAASVNVQLADISQAGQFILAGGNGDGSGNGTDAIATINGQTLTGTGNAFQYSDALGTYSFSVASGYTGTIDPVSVDSQAGQFSLAGGNGDGTATGSDAAATINGQAITGNGNAFEFTDALGTYSFSIATDYTGSISPVSVDSQAGQFILDGGNGDGTANGSDAVASINGQTIAGNGNTIHYTDDAGDFEIQLAEGYQGTFAPITVQSQSEDFQLQGGNGSGVSHGTNLVAVFNGVQQSNSSNQATVHGTNGTYQISFVSGFVGQFDSISVTKQAALTIVGGDGNGTAHGSDAIAVIDGQIETGDGASFTYSNQGTNVAIQFQPGFQGDFDPVLIGQNDQRPSGHSSTSALDLAQSFANSLSSLSRDNDELQFLQQGVNEGLLKFQFDQLRMLVNEISEQGRQLSEAIGSAHSNWQTNPALSIGSEDNDSSKWPVVQSNPAAASENSHVPQAHLSVLA